MSIKDFFRSEWPGVADAWRKWHLVARAQSSHATDWIVELAGVEAGMHVLDLASGVGDPALALARRVGSEGRVVASDLVDGALSFIERAARAEGLTWLATQTADIEQLPFGDATFDAVTCRLGIMFCPRPDMALREARRVLKPGGRAAFVAWGHPEQPLFKATLAAISESSSPAAEPTPPGRPGPFRFAAHGELSAELQRAGFSAVSEEHRQIPWPFHGSVEEFWEMFVDLAGPSFRRTLSAMGPDREQALVHRIILNLRQFRRDELVDPTALVVGCSGAAGSRGAAH